VSLNAHATRGRLKRYRLRSNPTGRGGVAPCPSTAMSLCSFPPQLDDQPVDAADFEVKVRRSLCCADPPRGRVHAHDRGHASILQPTQSSWASYRTAPPIAPNARRKGFRPHHIFSRSPRMCCPTYRVAARGPIGARRPVCSCPTAISKLPAKRQMAGADTRRLARSAQEAIPTYLALVAGDLGHISQIRLFTAFGQGRSALAIYCRAWPAKRARAITRWMR